MPFEIKVIAEPGSATRCGKCELIYRGACRAFGEDLEVAGARIFDTYHDHRRLPECIAAEGAGQKGGDK